ncbi:MAG: CapA family protein [Moorellales bacterium]
MSALSLLAVGDVILGANGEWLLSLAAPVLHEADVVVGQLEVPYTKRDPEALALEREPDNLAALVSSGFDVLTLASNHLWDAGRAGIEDTLAWLRAHNLGFVGAGMNLYEARQPWIVERKGTRFGFLAYNCVGPRETWATPRRPGCAYVHIITHYELDHATPGGPPAIYTWAEPASLENMCADIRNLRSSCDVLVVSLHKGIGHTRAKLAAYEYQVSHAAIEAGADIVLAHHAHMLRGVEVYKQKAIFHGLGNFAVFLPSSALGSDEDPQSWARRRKELFGFEPDPECPTYPFHREARYTIIAKFLVKEGRIFRAGFLPCLINRYGQPVVVPRKEGGQEVFDYMEAISREAGLDTKYGWEKDEIVVGLR